MVKRIIVGLFGIVAILGVFWVAKAEAAEATRPDCSEFAGLPKPQSTCFRKRKLAVRYANYDALQKTGLEFAYLARPVEGKELEKAYPDAAKAAKDKVEGKFLITFSVNTDGNVYDVKVVEASSQPISHLARLWADTIAQWKFVKPGKAVTDVPFRRVYLYSDEDSDKDRRSGG